jgi:hypothetical protein
MLLLLLSGTLDSRRKAIMFRTRICIKGKINLEWAEWFDGLQIQPGPSSDTILSGDLPDRSAVYGVISRFSSLGMTLISVTCEELPADCHTIEPDFCGHSVD